MPVLFHIMWYALAKQSMMSFRLFLQQWVMMSCNAIDRGGSSKKWGRYAVVTIGSLMLCLPINNNLTAVTSLKVDFSSGKA